MLESKIVLLNLYYIGVTIALLVRDILWLRTVMICAGSCLITYGIITNNSVVISWNFLFLSINLVQVIRLLIERKPIKINDEIIDLYTDIFSEMKKYEFLYFWKHGLIHDVDNDIICKEGELQKDLSLIISGKVLIKKDENVITELGRGRFIAEMGYITSHPASANVIAEGKVKYISWNKNSIDKMSKVYPDLKNKLQIIIGKDLIHKLKGE